MVGIAVVAVVGCQASRPPSPPAVAKKSPPLSFHAELGPITALAWDDPFLWIGTQRGLRRYRPGTNEELWLSNEPSTDLGAPGEAQPDEQAKKPEPGKDVSQPPATAAGAPAKEHGKGQGKQPEKGQASKADKKASADAGNAAPVRQPVKDREMLAQPITALAPASGPSLLVATATGVARLTDTGGDKPVLAPLVALAGVYRLAAVTDTTAVPEPGPSRGTPPVNPLAWMATERGLFLWDGAAVHLITPAGKEAGKNAGKEVGKNAGTNAGKRAETNAISFLQADPDGRSAWVGVMGQGLLHVDQHGTLQTFGPGGEGRPDFVDTLGMGMFPNGTPFAVGRGRDGSGRLLILHRGGPALFEVDPSVRLVGAAMEQGAPLVYASRGGLVGVYTLRWVERGERIPPDGFRFAPPRKREGDRIAALPDGRTLPEDITAHAAGPGGGVFFGTMGAGVARLGVPAHGVTVPPIYLPAGELAWNARSLEVACLERDRCVVATGAGPGWIWDGADNAYKPVPVEAMGSPLMALVGEGNSAGNGSGAVYFISGDGPKGIKIARLSPDGQAWEPLLTIPVDTEGAPLISYATMSPAGSLWMAVRDRLPDGQELGRGVIELQLPSGKFIYHRVTHAGQTHPPEMIPVPGDVRAVRFQAGTAAVPDAQWFCTSVGVLRAQPGKPPKLTHWTENDGLPSDSCEDLSVQDDGVVWAATREGVARWSGDRSNNGGWVPFEGAPQTPGGPLRWPASGRDDDDPDADPAAARAFVTVGASLWAGTSKGIWPVTGSGKVMDQRTGLLDSDVVGMKLDRFGRLWVLGHLGLTVTDTFPLR